MYRIILLCLMLLASLSLSICRAAAPPTLPNAHAAILLEDTTGEIIYEKNAAKRMPPASTTKILTAILAIESGHLSDHVTVSSAAAKTPGSEMHLISGQTLTLQELVTGLLLRSGNDAAVAIAEYLAGSVEAFADQMNARAAQLGATESHFVNPHGLPDPNHYVTARDLAKLAHYAMKNPIFSDIVGKRQAQIDWQDTQGTHEQSLTNTNKLLWRLAEADGIKTGTTGEAGPCLVASASKNGHRFISVLLNDPSRWQDAEKLLRWGFEEYTLLTGGEAGDYAGNADIIGGESDSISGILGDTRLALVKKETAEAAVTLTVWDDNLSAPIYRGQKIGTLFYYSDGQLLSSVDILAAETIEAVSPAHRILLHFTGWLKHLSQWSLL